MKRNFDCRDFERVFERWPLEGDEEATRALAAHVESCAPCRTRLQEYREISRLAAALKQSIEAPGLWPRIEAGLVRERAQPRRFPRRVPLLAGAIAAAALLLLLPTVLPTLLRPRAGVSRSTILADAEIETLVREERRIAARIGEIEPLFETRIAQEDHAAAIVSGGLAYLDGNIETCRRLCERNPANRSIRRALLQSAEKKLEILEAFVSR